MKYRAKIRSNRTHQFAYSEWYDYIEGASEFWWTEGNMSCDCNLETYFPDEPQTEECGEIRYHVFGLETEDGYIIPLMGHI